MVDDRPVTAETKSTNEAIQIATDLLTDTLRCEAVPIVLLVRANRADRARSSDGRSDDERHARNHSAGRPIGGAWVVRLHPRPPPHATRATSRPTTHVPREL